MQIFSKLVVTKLLIKNHRIHNLYAIFVKIIDICKKFSNDLDDGRGNIRRSGAVTIPFLFPISTSNTIISGDNSLSTSTMPHKDV